MSLRAVLFDIYGTLLSSAAGELHPDPALRDLIAKAHAASPHPFPEIDIREIHAARHPELGPEEIEALAIAHEKLVNPVTPMPGAAETLAQLAANGILLGLISNAQFYTVPILEETLGTTMTDLGIDLELCCFSYRERRAKPDPFLFEVVRDKLARRGIQPGEVLYVGNDVRNDVDPAGSCGFHTALFAGDSTSLRLRGRPLEKSGATFILPKLEDLPGLPDSDHPHS